MAAVDLQLRLPIALTSEDGEQKGGHFSQAFSVD